MARKKRKSYSELVAEEFIENLEKGTSFLQKRWEFGTLAAPYNAISGRPYRGANNFRLVQKKYGDPRWMTFKQASDLGAKVRKGEKGTPIIFWLFEEKRRAYDRETGKPIYDEDGNPKYEVVKLDRPKAIRSIVFNASQIEGIPAYKPEVRDPKLVNERIENIIKNIGVVVRNNYQNRAFYSPRLDEIHMPNFDQFKDPNSYYSTLLHEGVHATGHESRLNRDFGAKFGDVRYAKEELRAEIASYMLSQRLGVEFDPNHHYSYVNSWIQVLKNDPREIIRACSDAEKITEYVLSFDPDRDAEKDNTYETIEVLSVDEEQEAFKDKIYLNVPFSEKDEAKALGAKWDRYKKSWYCPESLDLKESKLDRWFDEAHDKSMNPEKYIEEDRDQEESKPKIKSFTLAWSENSDDENVKFQSLEEMDKWFKDTFRDGVPKAEDGYDKNKILIELENPSGEIWVAEYRVDVNESDWNFNPNRESIGEYLQGQLSDVDFSDVIENKNVNLEMESKSIDRGKDNIASKRVYLNVPFLEKNEAKALGAKWDRYKKSWYCPEGEDLDKFKKWNNPVESEPKLTVEEQFSRALESIGIKSDPHHNYNADGLIHRLPTHDDTGSKVSGAYALHLNQKIPGGWIKNMRTGEEINWKADIKVPSLSEKDIEQLRKEAETARKIREMNIRDKQNATAKVSQRLWSESLESDSHQYAEDKGMKVTKFKVVPSSVSAESHDSGLNVTDSVQEIKELREKGSYVFKSGDMVIPLMNLDGEVRSVQTISSYGDSKSFKSFAVGGEKQGMFYQTDGQVPNGKKPIYIAEGIATADAVSQLSNSPVVTVFDAGNIEPVVQSFRDRYPSTEIIIASDNDHHKKVVNGKELPNVGVEKAQEVAKKYNCLVVTPNFSPDDRGTDWNDLLLDQGFDEAKRQFSRELQQERELASPDFDR